jgi:hypothetical protein
MTEIIYAMEEMRRARQDRVVTCLEQILQRARNGEIGSVAIATVGQDLSTGSAYALGDKTLTELLGAIRLMEHRIMTAAENGPLD